MFCHDCGKEIADGAKFCPYCGQSQKLSESRSKTYTSHSDKAIAENVTSHQDATVSECAPKAEEAIQEDASTVVASAKSIGEDVNEATFGKAQTDADTARGTAQNFVKDVKQIAEDKDKETSENNNRNAKIAFGIIMVIVIMFMLFGGNSNYHNKAINEAEKAVRSINNDFSITSSNVLYEADKNELKYYIVEVNSTNKSKIKFSLIYGVSINTKTKETETYYQGVARNNAQRNSTINRVKRMLNGAGFTVKSVKG